MEVILAKSRSVIQKNTYSYCRYSDAFVSESGLTRVRKNHSIKVSEDLATENMTVSAKGTVEKPGKNEK